MDLVLDIWRQKDANSQGGYKTYSVKGVSPTMSFIEMLKLLNEQILEKGEDEPVAFEYDCLEGICGTCSLVIAGTPHGPQRATTTCQLHMRNFKDGDRISVEPWRAKAFPILKDLIVDRSSFDRIIQAGGFVSVRTGGTPDANVIPIPKIEADIAMDAAQCIGCGACVASCKNSSAMLFVAAKVAHLAHLPQGQVERKQRVVKMIEAMDKEGFGCCTNQNECEAACPKEISVKFISELNKEFRKALLS
ncbi:MAG: succinate dehydrogenase/fumarate reductase iron-sulfur subunit [Proteobacteria bacterium]|nr:succinate dehydrogenase/fumarate reductase iron-sulfur subunit [Pseudomonadota bacterium]